MSRRWIRLDVSWDHSEWIVALDPAAQLCWIKMLCWVKAHGVRGRCKALTNFVAGKKWDVSPKAVGKMLEAAVTHGAVEKEEGEWVVVEWDEYQETDPTAAERMRRYREKKRQEEEKEEALRRNDRNVTERNGVTRRATETETGTKAAPSGAGAREGPEAEMRATLARFAEGVSDEQERRKVVAQAEMVLTGEDRKAWETPEGGTVDVAERPELFRLALGFHRDGTQSALRSSVRYAVKLYTEDQDKEVDPSMGPAERKLAKRISKLRKLDLATSFQS